MRSDPRLLLAIRAVHCIWLKVMSVIRAADRHTGGHSVRTLFRSSIPHHHEQALTGWKVVEDEHGFLILERLYRTGSFLKALELCDRVAEVAEAEGHHPDIHLTGWNRLKLQLQTHSRRGLTEVIAYED